MFARLSRAIILFMLAFACLAAAMPNKRNNPTTITVTVTSTAAASNPTGSTCSTGAIQCCNNLESADSPAGSLLLGLLGVVVQGVDVVLGLDCSPISVIGVGGGNCNANVVCCQDNAVGGLISVGCLPVTL